MKRFVLSPYSLMRLELRCIPSQFVRCLLVILFFAFTVETAWYIDRHYWSIKSLKKGVLVYHVTSLRTIKGVGSSIFYATIVLWSFRILT